MAATTILADYREAPEQVSIAGGGAPGARGVTVIIDDTKIGTLIDAVNTLETIKRAIIRLGTKLPVA